MTDVSTSVDRRLFVGGERLRIDVDAPPSGGGEKYEPQTAEQARELLIPMMESLAEVAAGIPSRLRGDRVYMEARLLPNYLAASYFPEALLTRIGAVPVGSRADIGPYRTKTRETESGTRRLILAVEDRGIELLRMLIQQPGNSRSDQLAFAEIRKLDRLSIASSEEVVLSRPDDGERLSTWEAVLHPYTTIRGEPAPLDPTTMEKWFTLIESLGGRSHRDYVRDVGGLTFAPIVLAASQADRAATFNPLRALRPMPVIRPRPRFGTRSLPRSIPPTTTDPAASEPLVVVFDGGVSDSPTPFIPNPSVDLTTEPPDHEDTAHGTGVTGAVMYGLIGPGIAAEQMPCPIDSFRVLPAPNIPGDLDGYWVLDRIKEAVIAMQPDIVNLSLGPELATEDTTEPNRWTSELDQLAWESDVLFVVAAGNYGDEDRDLGLHRVQVPGDMVNGLTVGACDVTSPENPWGRVTYSSMGPGRHGNRIQPAGVQFGGTDANPFPVMRADGSFLQATGTSFSAPLVTHALAELSTRLPVAAPSVLRAFAVHFAERHRTYKKLIDEVGHGRFPLDFRPLLDTASNEAHVLFTDDIERDEMIGYQIPLPDGIAGPLSLWITLAYVSPVEPSQPTEYTRASLEMVLRPHHLHHRLRPPKGSPGLRAVVLDHTSDEAFRLFQEGWEMSQEPVTKTLGAAPGSSESTLRDAGKWETVRHHRLNLRAGEAERPRLIISYLARRAGLLDHGPNAIPFAVIVSMKDPASGSDLHDRIAAEFPVLTPLPRSEARIRALRLRSRN